MHKLKVPLQAIRKTEEDWGRLGRSSHTRESDRWFHFLGFGAIKKILRLRYKQAHERGSEAGCYTLPTHIAC